MRSPSMIQVPERKTLEAVGEDLDTGEHVLRGRPKHVTLTGAGRLSGKLAS